MQSSGRLCIWPVRNRRPEADGLSLEEEDKRQSRLSMMETSMLKSALFLWMKLLLREREGMMSRRSCALSIHLQSIVCFIMLDARKVCQLFVNIIICK